MASRWRIAAVVAAVLCAVASASAGDIVAAAVSCPAFSVLNDPTAEGSDVAVRVSVNTTAPMTGSSTVIFEAAVAVSFSSTFAVGDLRPLDNTSKIGLFSVATAAGENTTVVPVLQSSAVTSPADGVTSFDIAASAFSDGALTLPRPISSAPFSAAGGLISVTVAIRRRLNDSTTETEHVLTSVACLTALSPQPVVSAVSTVVPTGGSTSSGLATITVPALYANSTASVSVPAMLMYPSSTDSTPPSLSVAVAAPSASGAAASPFSDCALASAASLSASTWVSRTIAAPTASSAVVSFPSGAASHAVLLRPRCSVQRAAFPEFASVVSSPVDATSAVVSFDTAPLLMQATVTVQGPAPSAAWVGGGSHEDGPGAGSAGKYFDPPTFRLDPPAAATITVGATSETVASQSYYKVTASSIVDAVGKDGVAFDSTWTLFDTSGAVTPAPASGTTPSPSTSAPTVTINDEDSFLLVRSLFPTTAALRPSLTVAVEVHVAQGTATWKYVMCGVLLGAAWLLYLVFGLYGYAQQRGYITGSPTQDRITSTPIVAERQRQPQTAARAPFAQQGPRMPPRPVQPRSRSWGSRTASTAALPPPVERTAPPLLHAPLAQPPVQAPARALAKAQPRPRSRTAAPTSQLRPSGSYYLRGSAAPTDTDPPPFFSKEMRNPKGAAPRPKEDEQEDSEWWDMSSIMDPVGRSAKKKTAKATSGRSDGAHPANPIELDRSRALDVLAVKYRYHDRSAAAAIDPFTPQRQPVIGRSGTARGGDWLTPTAATADEYSYSDDTPDDFQDPNATGGYRSDHHTAAVDPRRLPPAYDTTLTHSDGYGLVRSEYAADTAPILDHTDDVRTRPSPSRHLSPTPPPRFVADEWLGRHSGTSRTTSAAPRGVPGPEPRRRFRRRVHRDGTYTDRIIHEQNVHQGQGEGESLGHQSINVDVLPSAVVPMPPDTSSEESEEYEDEDEEEEEESAQRNSGGERDNAVAETDEESNAASDDSTDEEDEIDGAVPAWIVRAYNSCGFCGPCGPVEGSDDDNNGDGKDRHRKLRRKTSSRPFPAYRRGEAVFNGIAEAFLFAASIAWIVQVTSFPGCPRGYTVVSIILVLLMVLMIAVRVLWANRVVPQHSPHFFPVLAIAMPVIATDREMHAVEGERMFWGGATRLFLDIPSFVLVLALLANHPRRGTDGSLVLLFTSLSGILFGFRGLGVVLWQLPRAVRGLLQYLGTCSQTSVPVVVPPRPAPALPDGEAALERHLRDVQSKLDRVRAASAAPPPAVPGAAQPAGSVSAIPPANPLAAQQAAALPAGATTATHVPATATAASAGPTILPPLSVPGSPGANAAPPDVSRRKVVVHRGPGHSQPSPSSITSLVSSGRATQGAAAFVAAHDGTTTVDGEPLAASANLRPEGSEPFTTGGDTAMPQEDAAARLQQLRENHRRRASGSSPPPELSSGAVTSAVPAVSTDPFEQQDEPRSVPPPDVLQREAVAPSAPASNTAQAAAAEPLAERDIALAQFAVLDPGFPSADAPSAPVIAGNEAHQAAASEASPNIGSGTAGPPFSPEDASPVPQVAVAPAEPFAAAPVQASAPASAVAPSSSASVADPVASEVAAPRIVVMPPGSPKPRGSVSAIGPGFGQHTQHSQGPTAGSPKVVVKRPSQDRAAVTALEPQALVRQPSDGASSLASSAMIVGQAPVRQPEPTGGHPATGSPQRHSDPSGLVTSSAELSPSPSLGAVPPTAIQPKVVTHTGPLPPEVLAAMKAAKGPHRHPSPSATAAPAAAPTAVATSAAVGSPRQSVVSAGPMSPSRRGTVHPEVVAVQPVVVPPTSPRAVSPMIRSGSGVFGALDGPQRLSDSTTHPQGPPVVQRQPSDSDLGTPASVDDTKEKHKDKKAKRDKKEKEGKDKEKPAKDKKEKKAKKAHGEPSSRRSSVGSKASDVEPPVASSSPSPSTAPSAAQQAHDVVAPPALHLRRKVVVKPAGSHPHPGSPSQASAQGPSNAAVSDPRLEEHRPPALVIPAHSRPVSMDIGRPPLSPGASPEHGMSPGQPSLIAASPQGSSQLNESEMNRLL